MTLDEKGFSKNHRSDVPQIMIGLFTDNDGYPFDFDVFSGNIFEGHTFPAAVKKLIDKYEFTRLTVVADAAMLSTDNLSFLESHGVNYIVGARLKKLPQELITEVADFDYSSGAIYSADWEGRRLIVDFSALRAQTDAVNRDRLVKKLKTRLMKKQAVIRKSKYLRWGQRGRVAGIDQKQIEADQRFDGLKGYITNQNNRLEAKEVIEQYHNLWRIEKAFRMSKGDLKERPIYHRYSSRIKSHLLVCFVSLLVMKAAETILSRKRYSLERTIEILGRVGQGKTRIGNICLDIDSELDQETQSILQLFTGH